MKTVRMLLEQKGHDVWFVAPDDHVIDALAVMADKNIGALLVMEAGEVVGIFSERDYARKGELSGKTGEQTLIRELMTGRVIGVSPNRTVEECMAVMTNKRIRHLPVFDQERCVGLISIGDVVKSIIDQQEFIIQQLENYITYPR